MKRPDFEIGRAFRCGDGHWRCTDIGTRVVTAIRIDQATIASLQNGVRSERTIFGDEAERQGWFAGPPYAVAESVFDEYDMEGCFIDPSEDPQLPGSSFTTKALGT